MTMCAICGTDDAPYSWEEADPDTGLPHPPDDLFETALCDRCYSNAYHMIERVRTARALRAAGHVCAICSKPAAPARCGEPISVPWRKHLCRDHWEMTVEDLERLLGPAPCCICGGARGLDSPHYKQRPICAVCIDAPGDLAVLLKAGLKLRATDARCAACGRPAAPNGNGGTEVSLGGTLGKVHLCRRHWYTGIAEIANAIAQRKVFPRSLPDDPFAIPE